MNQNLSSNGKTTKSILLLVCICLLSLLQQGCNAGGSKNSDFVGFAKTYWVNQFNITDYSKEITCPVYRNSDGHWYEIEYEGVRHELVREIPLDVNENGSLILKYRFMDMNHYIEDIP